MEGATDSAAAWSFYLELTPDGLVIGKYILSRPQFGSPNYNFIKYMLDHSNEMLRFENIVKEANLPKSSTKRLSHYLNELGFKGGLKKLYWPVTNGGIVHLQNPILSNRLGYYFPSDKKYFTIDDLLNL
jgi:hypothetical protein